MNDKSTIEYIFDNTNSWINNIDSKISYALSLVGILIGFILIKGLPNAFSEWANASKITFLIFLKASIVVFLYISSLTTICFFVLALLARVTQNKKASHIFFGSISTFELQKFTKEFLALSEKGYVEELLEQIHTNSCICSKKVKLYNYGIKGLFVTVILCFICIVFQLL